MELRLPYINPQRFASALINGYRFHKQETWNSQRLTMPDDLGEGSLQLFIRNDIHFFRGKWRFNEQTIFFSDDPVAKMGVIDFRVSASGQIQSAAIQGYKQFEFDTTRVDGMRIFIPEAFFDTGKSKLMQRFESYCYDKNIRGLLNEVFNIDVNEVKHSILLESKILEFVHYWRDFLGKKDISRYFQGCSDHQLHSVNQAKLLLDENVGNPLLIRDLARKTGMNECDLKRVFRLVFGLPIRQYVIKARMEQARDWILHTDRPIAEICDCLNYSNRGHFSTLYQKFFGNTPLADRLRERG